MRTDCRLNALRERTRSLCFRCRRPFPRLTFDYRLYQLGTMQEGQVIRWRGVNGLSKGVVAEEWRQRKTGELMGYKVILPSGKITIVNQKSIIKGQ